MEGLNARAVKEHLDELTAIVETLRCAIAAIGPQLPNQEQLAKDYDDCAETFYALILGQDKSDQYLNQVREHIVKTRRFLVGMEQ